MKIKNKDLEKVIPVLYELKLTNGKESRMRTKLQTMLEEKYKEFNTYHSKLIMQYSNKDDNGKPKRIKENGVEMFDMHDIISFNKEYQELCEEYAVIDDIESNKEILSTVKQSIIKMDESESELEFTKEFALGFDILYDALTC